MSKVNITKFISWIKVNPKEFRAVLLSFIYFFCLLSGYYVLRPIRDEMGIAAGVDNLQWLFSETFVAMLLIVPIFGLITKRYARRKFIPAIYIFFIVNILCFFFLFNSDIPVSILAPIFFIWLSVFNLFVVSVFWSFMTDIFSNNQSKRVFGIISAGGSAGAITGPVITTTLAKPLGPINLLLISAMMLTFATICILQLINWSKENSIGFSNSEHINSEAIGGSIFAGISSVFRSKYLMSIGGLVMLYTAVSTFLYFEQAHIVDRVFDDPASRTRLFGGIDLITNTLAIFGQLFLTSRFIKKFGMALTLASIPLLVMLGFFSLSLAVVLPTIVIMQVVHRAGNYSLLRPGREILLTVVNREDRYKAKNFIDTTIYRGGDALTGWAFAGLLTIGFNLSGIAIVAVPVAGAWMLLGYFLGKNQDKMKMITNFPLAVSPENVNLKSIDP